jgi:putative ABC transport system permease protein
MENYPLIEETTHLTRGVASDFSYDERTLQVAGYFADPAFFKVFDFRIESGNPENALTAPNSVVIAETFARRLFNHDDPLGKVVVIRNPAGDSTVHWGDYVITGVLADEKHKSHLKFDVLLSASTIPRLAKEGKTGERANDWQTNHSYTYALLAPGKTQDALTASLNSAGPGPSHHRITNLKSVQKQSGRRLKNGVTLNWIT